MNGTNKRFRYKFRVLKDIENKRIYDKEVLIDDREVFEQLSPAIHKDRFLGLFSESEMQQVLLKFEILPSLMTRGFRQPKIQLLTDDTNEHKCRIYDDEIRNDHLLVEMVLRLTCIPPQKVFNEKMPTLFVEWLLSQNPKSQFDERKPRLPGQRFPGLGLAKELLDILIFISQKAEVSGVSAIPGHYHNAVIFSKFFRYMNPESEGRLAALKRDLSRYPLATISWAVELNCVKELPGKEYLKWFLDWQVLPTDRTLDEAFRCAEYIRTEKQAFRTHRYEMDEEKFASEKQRIDKMIEVII